MNKLIIIFSFVLIFLIYSFNSLIARDAQSENKISIIPGVVVVKLKPGFDIDRITNSTKSLPLKNISQAFPYHSKSSPLSRIYYLIYEPAWQPEEIAAELSQWEIFEYVEPKYLSYVSVTIPNDTLLSRQFHLAQVNMFAAWYIEQGSSNIVIAIVDNGTDYQHPDLISNIWTNQAEVHGNSGIDDDHNGYIDDICGWDFGDNDNNPTYGTDESIIAVHGTHTAGIASAVTNNITGISGVGWNCSIMPIKVSTDDDTYQIPFGYEGIVYAADNGAQVINNSWGRRGIYSQFEQDIINYAVSKGCIIVAAGGNSNMETIYYPAGYVHVIAVAAVNELDEKTSYSTYGRFIDLSAPGGDRRVGRPGIFSTYPIARGGYGELSGTSMASPVVAGIFGLLVNKFPDFNLLQLSRQIVLTADNIDNLNENYQGLIGFGRANSFRALMEDVQEEELVKINLFKVVIHDSTGGNSNFLFERNETIAVDVWYQNYAVSPGRNLTINLATDDSDLIITKSLATINYVPSDSIFAIRNRLKFRIKSQAKPHVVKLILNHSLDNGPGDSDTLFSIIGKSSVLFVDDDNGNRNVEGFYTSILDRLNISYLRWDHAQLGTPPPGTIIYFPMIIWSCEWAFPSLTPDDRIVIQYYLNQGGNLFISGQDIGWDLADQASENYSEHSAQFYQAFLHSTYRADNSGSQTVLGMPGTIGQGMQFDIYQPKIPYHFQFPEWIEPVPDAMLAFQYQTGKGAATSFSGNHKVLNLGFGFEAVAASQDEDPNRPSRQRTELLQRILNSLGPIRHQPLSDQENITDALSFAVELSPQIDDLQSLSLFWKTDTMSDYSSLPMDELGCRVFQQVLKLQSYTGQVQYYFEMSTPYYHFNLPVTGRNTPYAFHIGRDTTPPEIYHIPLKDIFIQNDNRKVEVFVNDNFAVDTSAVWLYYKTKTVEDSSLMIFSGNQRYESSIPQILDFGDSVSYYFSATDLANVPNRAISLVFSYKIGIEGFEYGMDFWTADSNSWAIDDREFHSGKYCISSSPGKAYQNNINIHLTSKYGIKRSNLNDVKLTLWIRHELEDNDSGFVEISVDNGENWQVIGNSVAGVFESWHREIFDLGAFYSQTKDTLLLRFRMQTDSSQIQPKAGWLIDDIAIQPKSYSYVSEKVPTARSAMPVMRIASNSPNPFNTVTTIAYQLSISGEVTFEIYNLLGQVVTRRSIGFQETGQYHLFWNGTDMKGQPCESGIYLGRLILKNLESNSSKRISRTIKMIFIE